MKRYTYQVTVRGRKEGNTLDQHGAERRSYDVEAKSFDDARQAAIERAYQEGGLEHIMVNSVVQLRG